MTDTIIQVEHLSKKYLLGQQKRSGSFREALTASAKSVGRKIRFPTRRSSPSTLEEFWALDDVSFEIKRGDRVGIVGRNGAGKSTLLKILSRITEPTEGRIQINGRVASLLEVGTGFHPELTGRENIFLNGAILGMSRLEIQRKFDEIVDFAEVEKFLDTPVKRYSSGMYVRLAFAVAAHLEPEILIVDEVLAVGDAQFQKKCLGKMENVAEQEGRTVIFVSHNMTAVRSLCSTGLLMQGGKLVLGGDIHTVSDEYLKGTANASYRATKQSGTRFVDVCLQDEEGKILEFLEPHQRAFLTFQIFVEENRDLNLGFTLYKSDIPIVSSTTLETAQPLSKGFSELKIELPVHLLTTGEYRVEGALWNYFKVFDKDDYLTSFKMNRYSALEAQGGKYKAVLAFAGQWTAKTELQL